MILKGSQRSGPRQLAAHLLNDRDNDHVTVHELRGFMADDLYGAMAEAQAVSKGTHCKQAVFSLSLNPPKDGQASLDAFIDAADRAEAVLGLKNQPRAIVIHEKNGRRHAHVVWSRIDPEEMKAVNLPFFKTKLRDLSRELYLEYGWELPDGHKTNGWKNPLNFTLAEWQQAKRLDLDPREIKAVFQSAWERSDNVRSFSNALEEHGYFLAKGDRRGLVALDIHGEAFSVSRWTGVKAKEVRQKLGDPEQLPGVDQIRKTTQQRLSTQLRGFLREDRANKAKELTPYLEARAKMVADQRRERERLAAKQDERWRMESKERAQRFGRGLRAIMDLLTGKTANTKRDNEKEAYQGLLRDRAQRENLFKVHNQERELLQEMIDKVRYRQRQDRKQLARRIAALLSAKSMAGEESNLAQERHKIRRLTI
ncbi:relaxase/mobilization nuclease domain-containing protein [uncultured Bradyrhizobium sp.]|uniref:relaxase/mobilization nuclease domain-containing protein n=1 Tax=uncultured Bradyrhizobium sp. TaxID=199684 RepID=UPI0035CA49C6